MPVHILHYACHSTYDEFICLIHTPCLAFAPQHSAPSLFGALHVYMNHNARVVMSIPHAHICLGSTTHCCGNDNAESCSMQPQPPFSPHPHFTLQDAHSALMDACSARAPPASVSDIISLMASCMSTRLLSWLPTAFTDDFATVRSSLSLAASTASQFASSLDELSEVFSDLHVDTEPLTNAANRLEQVLRVSCQRTRRSCIL